MSDVTAAAGMQRIPLLRQVMRLRNDSLLRNSLFLMATNALTSGLGYIYWVVAVRTYTASDVGLVSAVISTMTLTSLICNLGFTPALFQTLARRSPGHDWSLTLNTSFLVTTITSLAGAFVVLLLFQASPEFSTVAQNSGFAAAFLVSVPIWTVGNLIDATFQAERDSGKVLTRNAAFAILKMLLLFGFVPLHVGGIGIFLSWVLGCALSLYIGIRLLRRMDRQYTPVFRGAFREARSMLSSLIGHHFISIGGALPFYLLPVIVTARLSAEDNAYFYTTWMLGTLFAIVSVAVAQSLFAEGAHAGTHLLKSMQRSILIIVALLAPIMAVFFIFGGQILSIFGPNYPLRGLELLHLLTIATVPDAITSVYISVLRTQHRLREAAILNILMAFIVLIVAWFLLPTMGIAAVGWGWFISQLVGTVIVVVDFVITRRTRRDTLWAEVAPETIPA